MARWERLEEYLFDKDLLGKDFSAKEYAEEKGFEYVEEATFDIQYYLRAQRSKRSRTLYILRRKPGTRTTNARWAVGARSKDARLIGKGLSSDTRRRVERAFMPDLRRLGAINPRARKLVESQIEMVIDGAMRILEAASQGAYHGDDEE